MVARLLMESSTTMALSGRASASSDIIRAGVMGLLSHLAATDSSKALRFSAAAATTPILRPAISFSISGVIRGFMERISSSMASPQWDTIPTSVGSDLPARPGIGSMWTSLVFPPRMMSPQ